MSTSSADVVIGIVSEVSDTGLRLIQGNAVYPFTFDELRSIERSEGVERRWKQGMYIGGAMGIVIGAAAGREVEVCDGDAIAQIFFSDTVTCTTENHAISMAMRGRDSVRRPRSGRRSVDQAGGVDGRFDSVIRWGSRRRRHRVPDTARLAARALPLAYPDSERERPPGKTNERVLEPVCRADDGRISAPSSK